MTISKGRQLRLLRQSAMMFARNKVANEPSVFRWMKIVFFAHNHGYLYCGFDKNGDVNVACIAYRVVHVERSDRDTIPELEEGNTIYVHSAVSRSNDRMGLFRLMKWYLREHPYVTQVAYYRLRDKEHRLIIRELNHKEGSHVKKEII